MNLNMEHPDPSNGFLNGEDHGQDHPNASSPFFDELDPSMDPARTDHAFLTEYGAYRQELANICCLCGNPCGPLPPNHNAVTLSCGHMFGCSCFTHWSPEGPVCILCNWEHGCENFSIPAIIAEAVRDVVNGDALPMDMQYLQPSSGDLSAYEDAYSYMPDQRLSPLLQGQNPHQAMVEAPPYPNTCVHVQTEEDYATFTQVFDQNTAGVARALQDLHRDYNLQQSLDDPMTTLTDLYVCMDIEPLCEDDVSEA